MPVESAREYEFPWIAAGSGAVAISIAGPPVGFFQKEKHEVHVAHFLAHRRGGVPITLFSCP